MTLPTVARSRPRGGGGAGSGAGGGGYSTLRCCAAILVVVVVGSLGSMIFHDGPNRRGSNNSSSSSVYSNNNAAANDKLGKSTVDTLSSKARSLLSSPSTSSSNAGSKEIAFKAGGSLVDLSRSPSTENKPILKVFQSHRGEADRRRMAALILAEGSDGATSSSGVSASSPHVAIEHVSQNAQEQRQYIVQNGSKCYKNGHGSETALAAYDALVKGGQDHLAIELWKYCALAVEGGAYLDSDSALLATFRDAFLASPREKPGSASNAAGAYRNVAVLGDSRISFSRGTVHGSLLVLDQPYSPVATGMVQLLVEADVDALAFDPTVLPRALYDLIVKALEGNSLEPGDYGSWTILRQRCHVEQSTDLMVDLEKGSAHSAKIMAVAHQCPKQSGYCCDIVDPSMDLVMMMTRHPLVPFQLLPTGIGAHPKPYRWDKLGEGGRGKGEVGDNAVTHAPFIATIHEEVMVKPKESPATPNFFDILLANDCLPDDKPCGLCMKNKAGATCETCKDICKCYCASLCKTPVGEKFISKKITITPPIYRKDPTRLIPRIVHQTWFEEVTKEKYPNMSRLIESWKRSGWEYRFYSDSDAAEYLSLHFPPEVREAYDSILPGAFKADLFRYCALLIDGGVYADMDVLLETNLDAAVPGDVGFMTPVDEPGLASGHRMCLWNGLIASAPGHPFLARVIENVVNNARNRFTSVDTDNTLCPNPELSVSHSFDMLFTAGPCMLGRSINDLLRRHPQTSYEPGTINIWGIGEDAFGADPTDLRHAIPGRSIILKQDKYDMGAHRFTWEEENLVIAATDMPDYDDRDKLEDNVHYSDTHVKFGVYGLEKLYTDNVKADEKILMSVSQATGTSSSLAQQ